MEKQIQIPLNKSKVMHGVLAYSGKKPDAVVIFIHGLCGFDSFPPLLHASRYFVSKGFASFRCNLYSWRPRGRRFQETSLRIHAKDLNIAVQYFSKKFQKIFLVGHSFGGLTILRAQNSSVAAVSLWDPSSLIECPAKGYFRYSRKLRSYIIDGDCQIIVGDKFREDLLSFPDELELVKKLECPVHIAYASGPEAVLKASSKRYFRNATSLKQISEIKGASHCFIETGSDQKLCEVTAKWFNKFH